MAGIVKDLAEIAQSVAIICLGIVVLHMQRKSRSSGAIEVWNRNSSFGGAQDGADEQRRVGIAKPGDVVVVEAVGSPTDEQWRSLDANIQLVSNETGVRFIVLSGDIRLARISPEGNDLGDTERNEEEN